MAFVVNPREVVHSVPDEWVVALLRQGFRPATLEDVERYYRSQGLEVPEEYKMAPDKPHKGKTGKSKKGGQ